VQSQRAVQLAFALALLLVLVIQAFFWSHAAGAAPPVGAICTSCRRPAGASPGL